MDWGCIQSQGRDGQHCSIHDQLHSKEGLVGSHPMDPKQLAQEQEQPTEQHWEPRQELHKEQLQEQHQELLHKEVVVVVVEVHR